MKITIQSTEKLVEFQTEHGMPLVPARVWEGFTEDGTPVHCFVTRIVPTIPKDDPRQAPFEEQLQEHVPPTVLGYPVRMIL